MKRKFILADESFARWKKDPTFVAAHDALEAEFALADEREAIRQGDEDVATGCTQPAQEVFVRMRARHAISR